MSTQSEVSINFKTSLRKTGLAMYWIWLQLMKMNFTGGVWLCFCFGEMGGWAKAGIAHDSFLFFFFSRAMLRLEMNVWHWVVGAVVIYYYPRKAFSSMIWFDFVAPIPLNKLCSLSEIRTGRMHSRRLIWASYSFAECLCLCKGASSCIFNLE